jgi:hypothetical protein
MNLSAGAPTMPAQIRRPQHTTLPRCASLVFAVASSVLGGVPPPLDPGVVRRKPRRNAALFWPVAIAHAAWCAAYVLYPFLIAPRATPRMDALFLLYSVLCVAHWLLLGECSVTYLEKRLTYDGYALGSAPGRNWLYDILPDYAAAAVLQSFLVLAAAAFLTVLLRTIMRAPLAHSALAVAAAPQ